MMMYNDPVSGSKADLTVLYTGNFSPFNIGHASDISRVKYEVAVNGNHGISIGIGLPVPHRHFPRKSEVRKWLTKVNIDVPGFEENFDYLKGAMDSIPKNGGFDTLFERYITMGKILSGEVPFDGEAAELMSDDFFKHLHNAVEVSVYPKFAHNVWPWRFDYLVFEDKQGYDEPPRSEVDKQYMFVGDAGHLQRAHEKGPEGRNISLNLIQCQDLPAATLSKRNTPVLSRETVDEIKDAINRRNYVFCVVPPSQQKRLNNRQRNLIEKTYDTAVSEGTDLVVGIPIKPVPVDHGDNKCFWMGRHNNPLPYQILEEVKGYTGAYARGNGRLPTERIHFSYVEVDRRGKIIDNSAFNSSALPPRRIEIEPEAESERFSIVVNNPFAALGEAGRKILDKANSHLTGNNGLII